MNIELLLDKFVEQSKVLKEKLKGINEEALNFRPFIDGAWTIQEHFIHLVDSEINAFLRFKTILAESGKEVSVIDEEKWIKGIESHRISAEQYLIVFDLLRILAKDYLRGISQNIWDQSYIIHPQAGKVTLLQWLEAYIKHVEDHLEYIDRNLDIYSSGV